MNNQIPFGYNQMPQMYGVQVPGQNFNQMPVESLNVLEQRIRNLETKVSNIEKKLNMNTSDNMDGYNPYMSSMHMM